MAKRTASSQKAAVVKSELILSGVFFALRQAWELLSAATALQRATNFSSAYGLAVFSREEIGKSKLLERHWRDSLSGKCVLVHDLNSGDLRSHSKKLRAAGKVLSEGVFFQGEPPDPSSREASELLSRIRKINKGARERDPDRTHLGRQRAFYVEMHEAGIGWWKPWTQFDSTRSSGEILEAESAYTLRRCELESLKTEVEHMDIVLANSLYLPPDLTSA